MSDRLMPLMLLILPAAAMAQTPEPVDDEYHSVVVGKRQREDPFLCDRSVSIVDRAALKEHPPRTLPEALRDSVGVFVQQTNTGGGSPILRGMIGPQNLILVDGVRLNNSVHRTGPTQYLNLIDPYSVSHVEVLRGPGSVLYGSDAMGGVIQVFPLAPRPSWPRQEPQYGGDLLLRYSSANQGEVANGRFESAYRGVSWIGGVTAKVFRDLRGGRGIGEQPYSGYQSYSGMGSVVYRLANGWSWTTTYLMSHIIDAGRTDKLRDSRSLQLYDNIDDLAYSRLRFKLPHATGGEATVSYQHFNERKDSLVLDDSRAFRVRGTLDKVTAHTLGLDLNMTTRLLGGRLATRYGGMWYHDWVDAARLAWRHRDPAWLPQSKTSYPSGSGYDNFGGYVMLEGDLVRSSSGHLLRLNAGYRLNGMAGEAPEGAAPGVDFSHLGHVFLGSAQYLYRDRANAALTFSQGFRAPNLNEAVMTGDTGKYFHVPNTSLGPEYSNTIELLARGVMGPLRVGAATYVSLLQDLIRREDTVWQGQTEVEGKPVAHNVNGGDGTIWGVETWAALAIGAGLSVVGNIALTWGEEHLPTGDVPLSRIPPLFGRAVLRYDTRPGPWWGFIETYVRFADRQSRLSPEDEKDARIPQGGTPRWWTWNIAAGLVLEPRFRLSLAMENLLDRAYRYHGSGFDAAGTNVLLTGEARF